MSKIVLDLELLHKINAFASKDDARHNLEGIRFDYRPENQDFVVVATDGRGLVVANAAAAWDGEAFESFSLGSDVLLPMDAFDKQFRQCDDGEEEYSDPVPFVPTIHVAIDTEAKTISFLQDGTKPAGKIDASEIIEEGYTRKFTPLDGIYPDYVRLIPSFDDLGPQSFLSVNPDLLSRIADLSKSKAAAILTNKTEHAPHVCIVSNGIHNAGFVCVFMDRRDTRPSGYPSWFSRKEKETA